MKYPEPVRLSGITVLLMVSVFCWSTGARSEEPTTLVVCAPGFPGNTAEAQPTMDELAGALARGAGWAGGRIAAAYYPDLASGLEALGREHAALALVPLAFYLEHRRQLDLRATLQVEQEPEVWSLVAGADAITAPQALAGWELAGISGYSPRFVRQVVLADWGELPGSVEIRFASRVLSVLRQAAGGDKVAALLDRAQTEALPSLPFAAQLEVVARSRPLIGTLLCRVGERQTDEEAAAVTSAFLALERLEGGRELLDTMRIARFRPVAAEQLASIERAFGAAEDPER